MDTVLLNVPKPKEIFVTLKASSFLYDAASDAYQVKFSESKLIANDTSRQSVIVLIPSSKVQANSQTQQLKDEDIDTILDEIAAKERYKKSSVSNNTSTSNYHTPNPSDFPSPTKGGPIKHNHDLSAPPSLKHNNTKSQKEKLAAKIASIPKPRKQAKIDIEPNKPRPRSPVASARSGTRGADHDRVIIRDRPRDRERTRDRSKERGRDRDRSKERASTSTPRKSLSPSPQRKVSDVSKRSSRRSERSLPKPQPRIAKKLPNLDDTKLTQNMKIEWLSCCHDDIHDNECRGDDGAGCNAMKRVKFVLHHYSAWMKYKSYVQNEQESDV